MPFRLACPTVMNGLLYYFFWGYLIAGGRLKEAGTAHWNSPNTGATNETGFTALPGGDRTVTGTFGAIGDNGYWWMSTETLPITLGQAKSWTLYQHRRYNELD